MEMQDVNHPSKRFRTHSPGGGGITGAAAAKLRHKEQQQEENGEVKARAGKGSAPPGALRPQWHPHSPAASRICRVSRASGGKDRHSKVLTAKGLRDRRVRLSVPTAIQFYDLQDRLGYDQPSKAVEWLIKAAAPAIADLPSLDGAFPAEGDTPPVVEEQEDAEVAELELADHHRLQEQQQPKSACSSTSETSKGSVLSLSRSEIRIKARVRARERTATAKEKENDKDDGGDHEGAAQFTSVQGHHLHSLNLQPSSQSSSFIELLTCGGSQQNQSHTHGPIPNLIPKQLRHSPSAPATVKADLFGQVGLFGEEGDKPQHPPGFPSQAHFNIAATRDHQELQQQQQQQFSFMPEHLIPMAVTAAGGDYINFSISSGIAGFNRGTLQSNFAPAQPNHHLQRLSSPVDGPNLPFFLSAAAQAASASWEGPFPAGFDSRLQLCYDGYRQSDLKGKGKN